ncbi:MAG: aminotransferase class I/II-fold pyridoxal phosphate-dependent enzyme [Muribaculaceae bacterium]|nr:aminotransferase class I/II-fold pyridoxal phosphate-dependent enzyme [Roseburia sp.]MCM1431960.1 aminotransferase class I/II-fold pyridoxal phosphate-dependent enzyme [Muribaculaceae bacterium]MCM1493590.1 aminotransferase class I/II-fold pyridoxal phosphate-dependent enzyme [Muribaculaceae bacterium]
MGVHGGDVYRNHVKMDFSVSVNPLGTPECVQNALHAAVSLCGQYPDPEAEKLKKAVSASLGVPEEYLLFGNGASELFMAVVHGIRPKKIVIPVPSFYGYEYAAKSAGSEILYYEMKPENHFCVKEDIKQILTEDVGLLFLASPNNPVGNLLDRERMGELLRHCRDREIYVLMDECFLEFCGASFSALSELKNSEHLILVRAYTKIFSIPGVRLGYLLCKKKAVRAKIAQQLPEWNLSCFAQEAGCLCAGQEKFILETQEYVKKERQFMEARLREHGLLVFPSMANFILVYSELPLYGKLLEKGILIRDCSNFRGLKKGYYRIAVKSRKENEILLRETGAL